MEDVVSFGCLFPSLFETKYQVNPAESSIELKVEKESRH
jgi:hypothetical protein